MKVHKTAIFHFTCSIMLHRDIGEETPTASQDEQGPTKEPLEEMEEPDGTVGTAGTLPTDSQDEVTIHPTEEEIKDID